jgi:Right handed beta helix region/Periplasmic copper-binding protein (NosD)
MRMIRCLLVLAIVTILCPLGAVAVDGVNEINQTSILAAGGFPYTIPAPGSYVLTGDLTPPPGIGALVAGADNIEIDLNGFTIVSPPGPAATGIDSAGFVGLVVRRGVVQGFGGAAIIAGSDSKVIETKLSGNSSGVMSGVDCLIVMNTIVDNTFPPGTGVNAQHCKIENNVIAGNAGTGITGAANVIVHNRIGSNGGGGILEFGASTIQQNVINANSSFGISDGLPPGAIVPIPPPVAPARTDIIANTISDTGPGVPVGGRGISFVIPTLVRDNTVSGNVSNGVYVGAASVVSGNTVNTNGGGVPGTGGVTVAAGSTVSGNSISFNTGFGLTLPGPPATASYTHNTITGNTGVQVISPATLTGGAGNVCFPIACP